MSVWSTAASTLALAIIAVSCVFAIPLFPNERSANTGSLILGMFLYNLCSGFLLYETGIYARLKTFVLLKTKLYLNWAQRYHVFKLDGHVALPALEFGHNSLSYFFFFGHILTQLYSIVNNTAFAIHRPDCYSSLGLVYDLTKVTFAILVILAINIKSDGRTSKVSLLIWSVVGAVCFSSAFQYVVIEVVWGYIDIVEKSILYPEYGLNITNGTTAVEYVEAIFKRNAKCLELFVFRDVAEYILELVPFSAEYFSLATFFCVVSWKNSAKEPLSDHHDGGPIPILPQMDHHDSQSHSCFFTLSRCWAIGISVALVLLTILSIVYFFIIMHHRNYLGGTWIFIGQQLVFQVILVVAEGTFYFRHMRIMQYTPSPPKHFQLDAAMLVFPLFPLGVLFVLRVFPDLVQLNDVHGNHLTSSEPIWAVLNIFLAVFNYCQVAFQAVFISEVFCRLRFGGLRKSGYFFMVLASLNFCVWLSWTLECKLITIHGRSYEIYGVVSWIIVVYATVPFVMFCFAHSTACFREIMIDCFDFEKNAPTGTDEQNGEEREEFLNSGSLELESNFGSRSGISVISNPKPVDQDTNSLLSSDSDLSNPKHDMYP